MRPVQNWFLPREVDVLARLREQAETAHAAVSALSRWTSGELTIGAAVEEVRQACDRDESARVEVGRALSESFITPLQPEDLWELSERLGELTQGCYSLVREAEVSNTESDAGLAGMVQAMQEAWWEVAAAIGQLPKQAGPAAVEDLPLQATAAVEHAYRAAIGSIDGADDVREEIRRRELYRRAEHCGETIGRIARRVHYAVVKLS